MNAFLDALEARGELPAACATIAFWLRDDRFLA